MFFVLVYMSKNHIVIQNLTSTVPGAGMRGFVGAVGGPRVMK